MSSNDVAVAVRGLGKAYTISHQARPTTLREALLDRLRKPLSRPERETFWALRDLEFDIARGDAVGIIGRNGAGKSTLLKILSNITQPTKGYVDLFGRVGSLLEVGTGFHQELTGRENIFLNGAILGMRRREIERQFDAIVEFSGVEQFLDTPVKRYSSGMFVRLAFAVAAHLNPDILIVDEVLAVGDAEFQQKCLGKMQDVAGEQGRTVLFVSHNEAAVRRLCNQAIYLRQGQVQFVGSPTDAFNAYRVHRNDSGFDASNRRHFSGKAEIVHAFLSQDGVSTTEIMGGAKPVLTVQVEAREQTNCYLELRLRDASGTPLLIAPLGPSQNINFRLAPGSHEFEFELQLPFLAEGKFSLDLLLTEMNVCYHDYIEEGLVFSVAGTPNPLTGWMLKQSDGLAPILLEALPMPASPTSPPEPSAMTFATRSAHEPSAAPDTDSSTGASSASTTDLNGSAPR